MPLRPDLAIIASAVPEGARVLDVGCGDGALMAALRDGKGVDVRGLEIDPTKVAAAMARGLSVMQGDADQDLAEYPDGAFDIAILSQTLQTTRCPAEVLAQLLRVGQSAFVSFPNFAHWRVRLSLLGRGRMPVNALLPASWYETPNIHHATVYDFEALVRARNYRIERAWFLAGGRRTGRLAPNWRAEYAIYRLTAPGGAGA